MNNNLNQQQGETMKGNEKVDESVGMQIAMRVVPLEAYCTAMKLEKSAIYGRLNRGTWRIGHEVIKTKGVKGLFVDLDAVDEWFRNPLNQVS